MEKKNQLKLASVISLIGTVLGLLYLILVLLGKVNRDKFGQTEAIVFATILLLSSTLVERVENIRVGKDGVTVNLTKKIEEVKDNQEKLQQIGKSNQQEIHNLVNFLVGNFLTQYEYSHLKKLSSNEPFSCTMKSSFEKELRHLRDLGLIESVKGTRLSISSLKKEIRDLKEFARITTRGRECLTAMEKVMNSEKKVVDSDD